MTDTANRKFRTQFHTPGVQTIRVANDDVAGFLSSVPGGWSVQLSCYGDKPVVCATRDDALALIDAFID